MHDNSPAKVDHAQTDRAGGTGERVVKFSFLVMTTTTGSHDLHVIHMEMERMCARATDGPFLHSIVVECCQRVVCIPYLAVDFGGTHRYIICVVDSRIRQILQMIGSWGIPSGCCIIEGSRGRGASGGHRQLSNRCAGKSDWKLTGTRTAHSKVHTTCPGQFKRRSDRRGNSRPPYAVICNSPNFAVLKSNGHDFRGNFHGGDTQTIPLICDNIKLFERLCIAKKVSVDFGCEPLRDARRGSSWVGLQ
jgi:hypothetical protein